MSMLDIATVLKARLGDAAKREGRARPRVEATITRGRDCRRRREADEIRHRRPGGSIGSNSSLAALPRCRPRY